MFQDNLERYQAFWARQRTARPLFGCNAGLFVTERYPRMMRVIPDGPVRPEDLRVDLFLEDCEELYQDYSKMGDDYCHTSAPFIYLPWMEAIMGCPIAFSGTSFWAEPCVDSWGSWHWQRPTLDNPWTEKLLAFMRALVQHSAGRYPVAPTLMRGPSDMMAAMRGTVQLPFDLVDSPDLAARAAQLCAEVFIEVGKAQLELIPESATGYMAGEHGLRTWAPDKIIWLQEDAMALLSPQLYRDFFLPLDRQIGGQFSCVAFHLHDSALWAIDDLVEVPEIDVLELNQDVGSADIEATFSGWKKIREKKPLVIWRMYDEGFWPLLDRILAEFPPCGLAIQITAKDEEEGKRVTDRFLEVAQRRRGELS